MTGDVLGSPVVDGSGGVLSIAVTASGTTTQQGSNAQVTCTGSAGTGLNAWTVLSGTGTFAVSGGNTSLSFMQVADLETVAKPGDIVLYRIGGNDEIHGVSIAQSLIDFTATVNRMLADGYYVIYVMEGPRSNWGGLADANATATTYRNQMLQRRLFAQHFASNPLANAAGIHQLHDD